MICKKYALLVGSVGIFVVGCGVDKPDNGPDSGQVVDGVYVNEYFGLTLPIPDDWFVASKDSEEHVREVGERALVGDDAVLRAAVEASQQTTFQLLTLSESEIGAAVEFNPNLVLMAERVSHVPGIKSGADLLFHTTKVLLASQLDYEVTKSPYSTQLGDRKWDRADFIFSVAQMTIRQGFISTKHHDFVVTMILSATTSEQMAALERVASLIVLEKAL